MTLIKQKIDYLYRLKIDYFKNFESVRDMTNFELFRDKPVIYLTISFCPILIVFKVFLFKFIISNPYKIREIQKDLYTKICKNGFTPPCLNPKELREKNEFFTF